MFSLLTLRIVQSAQWQFCVWCSSRKGRHRCAAPSNANLAVQSFSRAVAAVLLGRHRKAFFVFMYTSAPQNSRRARHGSSGAFDAVYTKRTLSSTRLWYYFLTIPLTASAESFAVDAATSSSKKTEHEKRSFRQPPYLCVVPPRSLQLELQASMAQEAARIRSTSISDGQLVVDWPKPDIAPPIAVATRTGTVGFRDGDGDDAGEHRSTAVPTIHMV